MPSLRCAVLPLAALGLAGCVTIANPVPIGQNAWLIQTEARGRGVSDADLLAQNIRDAGDFCAAKGRRLELHGTISNGIQGWASPSNQVTFKCLA